MAVRERVHAADLATAAPVAVPETAAVRVWAWVGGLILLFIAWVLLRWVTGPYFHRVPAGPTPLPGWMKANLIFWQAISPLAALTLIGALVVRPLIRERTIHLDGRFVLAFATLWFQDPLCNFTGSWVTYNSWMVNMGSWHADVPGSASFAAPGQMLAEPLLLIPFLYVYFFWLACVMGSRLMRGIARRRPSAGKPTLIAGCFLVICAFDFVLEGLIWMPGGAWTLAGGTDPVLFAGTYHQFTVNEWIPVSVTLTAVACIRHFRDDLGRTFAERGIDRLKVTPRRRLVMQTLAIVGAVQVAMFCCYTAPNFVFGLHATRWPDAVQARSYLTDYLCGEGTARACPGPEVPNIRNANGTAGRSTAYISHAGRLVLPTHARFPRLVPFTRG